MITAVLMASPSISHAQYAGSTIAPTTVNAFLENGKNAEQVVLQGGIIRYTGAELYRFADSAGETGLRSMQENRPANTPGDEKNEVRLHGEQEKELFGEPDIEVTQIRILK